MEKILITGGTGFIGSHLCELCVELGFNVKVFDRYNINNHYGWLEYSKYKDELEFVLGDVRDFDSVIKVMEGCKSVIHLAALIGIPYSYISPLAYIRTNIEGSYNVLEAAKIIDIEQILCTSTSETYGTAQYVPIDEKHPMSAQSPYAASKIAADQLALSYYSSFDLPVKIVRPFNTYGPRQSARAVIPTIIYQALNGNSKIKLGNFSPTRDLTFVKDTCHGFLDIYKSSKLFGEVTNIGVNEEISIGDLTLKILDLMGLNIPLVKDKVRVRPVNSEVEQLRCNNDRIINNTDWRPHYDLERGLSETIKWFEDTDYLQKSEQYYV